MNCPKCGKELNEGNLYCEECGSEIQIVPDFEPEIETKITETLSTLAENFEKQETTESKQQNLFTSFYHRFYNRIKEKKYVSAVVAVLVLFALFFVVFAGISAYQHNSYSYQLERALDYGEKEKYVEAISYMERALKINPEDKSTELVLADYYNKNGETDNAIYTLKDYIATQKENTEGYQSLLSIYEKQEAYLEINNLLLQCDNKEIIEQYGKYAAFPPEFSLEEGTYDEVIPLKIIANTSGTIYYTLDGTEPTKASEAYTAPIFLEKGIYEVKAIFINSYERTSDITVGNYVVDLAVPGPPEVNLNSGNYDSPGKIVVDVPLKSEVYYTTDGSEPDKGSILYTTSINMPLGDSHYKFISYGENGAAGEVTERQYHLMLTNVNVQYQDAINTTVLFLNSAGYLSDLEGHAETIEGRYLYTCNTAIKVDNQIFYLIVESHINLQEKQTKTGNMFGVSAMNGLIYKAELNKKGDYVIRVF